MSPRLHLFGAPTLESDGGRVALPFERRSQLLVLLALRRTWVGRAELASMLWPEQSTKLAYTNLRKTLFRLQALPWGVAIEAQGAALRVEADTDVAAFDAALREQQIDTALVLRRGELLAGFDDDANDAWSSWLHFERDRLRAAWRGAALERLGGDIDAVAGIDLSTRLLEADPFDEAALRVQLSLLAQTGQAARARQLYREFVARLADELGLAPSAELQALHDGLGTASAAHRPAPMPVAAQAEGEAGFIGRSVERQRIAELLARDDCRLLSLVGPGGVGKTRLARRVLHERAPAFADGTAFIPLEDVASAREFAARLVRELGLATGRRGEPLEQLVEALRGRRMLLVLDNFEQLSAEAPLLETLLQACPGLKLIVTSRVRLALAAEQLLPLEGLPCPEPEDQDRVDAFDAARLFVAAAQRVEPGLVPAAEAAAIVDICRQVEGLPLALELAAAWTRVLSCEAIAAELRQGIELLRAVDASHPPRHASIELVFEQSWQRLTAREREVLAGLSAFRGGFTAEAARAVAGAPLPVLSALADKSLLRKDGARLALHPLVQQLAAARLGDGPARDAVQAAHAGYFHRLLDQHRLAVDSGERTALRAVDTELENLRLAWQWSIAQGQLECIRRSARVLQNHFDHRGRFEDGLALLRLAIGAPMVQADPALLAMLLAEAAHFEYRLDRYAQAEAMASQALAAAGRGGEREVKSRALDVLAVCALRVGRLTDARHYFRQVHALAVAQKHAHNMAASLDHLALVEKRSGRYAEALQLSLDSLQQHRRIGDSAGVALCLSNLASLYQAQQDYAAAAPHLREALAICERDGLSGTLGYVLANLTEVAMKAGDLPAAEAYAARAIEVADATGNRAVASWMQIQRARAAVRRGDLPAARVALAAGLGLATMLGVPTMKAAALLCFAELLYAQGERLVAQRVLVFTVGQPMTSAPDRDEMRGQLERWGASPGAVAAWPGIGLDELLQRIVAEAGLAHAPLIALLQATP